LVYCSRSSHTKSGDGVQDFVSRLGPDEGFGVFIMHGEVILDCALKLARAAEGAAAYLLGCERGEETFDQIDPRGTGWGEVDVKARSLRDRVPDECRLVSAVVVGDQMHIEAVWDVGLNGVEELAKLRRSVAAMTLSDHLPAGHIESGKQRCGAVADIVV